MLSKGFAFIFVLGNAQGFVRGPRPIDFLFAILLVNDIPVLFQIGLQIASIGRQNDSHMVVFLEVCHFVRKRYSGVIPESVYGSMPSVFGPQRKSAIFLDFRRLLLKANNSVCPLVSICHIVLNASIPLPIIHTAPTTTKNKSCHFNKREKKLTGLDNALKKNT